MEGVFSNLRGDAGDLWTRQLGENRQMFTVGDVEETKYNKEAVAQLTVWGDSG